MTPHASFLAMQHEPRQAYDNLVKIEEELGAYGDGGFFDAVAVRSGKISERYLSLDQAMILGASATCSAATSFARRSAPARYGDGSGLLSLWSNSRPVSSADPRSRPRLPL